MKVKSIFLKAILTNLKILRIKLQSDFVNVKPPRQELGTSRRISKYVEVLDFMEPPKSIGMERSTCGEFSLRGPSVHLWLGGKWMFQICCQRF